MSDPVLEEMAVELRAALVAAGEDPNDPPGFDDRFPSARAFEEYRARGGKVYSDANTMAEALVRRVSHDELH